MCEVSKSPGNDNWPDVMSTGAILEGSVFNLPEGTVLKYDPDIKKYVSIEENEDLGPGNECYYSGSAIALDPFVVKDLGDIFRVIPEKLDYNDKGEHCNKEGYFDDSLSEELPNDNAEESPNDNFARRIKNLEGRISALENYVSSVISNVDSAKECCND